MSASCSIARRKRSVQRTPGNIPEHSSPAPSRHRHPCPPCVSVSVSSPPVDFWQHRVSRCTLLYCTHAVRVQLLELSSSVCCSPIRFIWQLREFVQLMPSGNELFRLARRVTVLENLRDPMRCRKSNEEVHVLCSRLHSVVPAALSKALIATAPDISKARYPLFMGPN